MTRAIAISVLVLICCAQHRAEQLPIRTYTTADGLARDRVYKIVPDPRGFLWFCTYDGLSRFDGYEFVNYSVAHGLPHRLVFDLLITRSGEYWVATSAGVARFNPLASTSESKFKTFLPSRPDAGVILDLYEDSSATIWAGTGNGLHRLRQTGNDWQIEYVSLGENESEQLDVSTTVEASPGVLWIGTEQGLFRRFSDGKVERFSTKDGLPHEHVRDILREPDGTIWVATGLGLCRLVSNVNMGQPIVERLYTRKDGMLSEGINSLFRTSDGQLWMATVLGISAFVPDAPFIDRFINYTREHGLSDAGIRTIAEDNDGNLWLGSESGGAMKITRRGFTSYSEADGLEVARIAAIGEDRNGPAVRDHEFAERSVVSHSWLRWPSLPKHSCQPAHRCSTNLGLESIVCPRSFAAVVGADNERTVSVSSVALARGAFEIKTTERLQLAEWSQRKRAVSTLRRLARRYLDQHYHHSLKLLPEQV